MLTLNADKSLAKKHTLTVRSIPYRHVAKNLHQISGARKRVGMTQQHESDSVIETSPRERHVGICREAVVVEKVVAVAHSPLLQPAQNLITVSSVTLVAASLRHNVAHKTSHLETSLVPYTFP